MEDLICKKVTSMMSLYMDDRLNEEHKAFVEDHFKKCPHCYQKYKEMRNIIENLKLSYEKIINKVEDIETISLFNIREYEKFYNNISAYIDNELTYDEGVEFRKYLLKSKAARADLKNLYALESNIKDSVSNCIENSNVNMSKRIIRIIKEENTPVRNNYFVKAAAVLAIVFFTTSGAYFVKHPEKFYNNNIFKHKKVIYVKSPQQATEVKGLISEKKP